MFVQVRADPCPEVRPRSDANISMPTDNVISRVRAAGTEETLHPFDEISRRRHNNPCDLVARNSAGHEHGWTSSTEKDSRRFKMARRQNPQRYPKTQLNHRWKRRIHPVISVEMLELATPDPYKRNEVDTAGKTVTDRRPLKILSHDCVVFK